MPQARNVRIFFWDLGVVEFRWDLVAIWGCDSKDRISSFHANVSRFITPCIRQGRQNPRGNPRERGCEKKLEPSGTSARPVLVLLPAASSKLHSGVLGGRKSRGCSRDHAAGVTVTRGVRRGSMGARCEDLFTHIFFISLFHRISSESDFQNDIFM